MLLKGVQSLDYQKSAFTKPKEEVNHIYLTMDEIKSIKEIDFSKRPNLDVCEGSFCHSCSYRVKGLRLQKLIYIQH